VLITVGLVVRRREGTVCRGRDVLVLQCALLVAATGAAVRDQTRASFALAALAGALALLAWTGRARWLVVAPRERLHGDIVSCLGRLVAPHRREGEHYLVTIPGGTLGIRVKPLWSRGTLVSFAPSVAHRKAELIIDLIAKQHRPLLPTIRIRQR
jgi:hypothetical protein